MSDAPENIIAFNPAGSENIVAVLEDLLKEARSGKITDLFLIAANTDDTLTAHYEPPSNFSIVIGAIELLKARYVQEVLSEW